MFEGLGFRKSTLDKISCNYLAEIIQEAAAHLVEGGFVRTYTIDTIRHIVVFGDWLKKNRIKVKNINNGHASDFAKDSTASVFSQKQRSIAARLAVKLILKKLPPPGDDYPEISKEVDRYIHYLEKHRGFLESAVALHKKYLNRFLRHFFSKRKEISVHLLKPIQIRKYMETVAANGPLTSRKRASAAIRGYLRFMKINGVDTMALSAAIPTFPYRRRSLNPEILTQEEWNTLLCTIDCSTVYGKRNCAVIYCLSDLGMRMGDVARLSLDDIDWRDGTLLVKTRKSSPYKLPISNRLGEALIDYLQNARPASKSRQVFLMHHSHPQGLPASPGGLCAGVRKTWEKSGLKRKFSGTHILRRTVATRLRQKGFPLKVIADVLGHQSTETTTLYAQIDIDSLRQVAFPWPQK